MRSGLFLFALFVAFASAQSFTDILVIDDFIVETPAIIILIPSNPSFEIRESTFVSGASSTIIGGERDLQLTVESGQTNLVLTTGVAGGAFTCSTPNEAAGSSLLQWDGTDGTMALSNAGFGATNFRVNSGQAFRTLIESDIATTIEFRAHSSSGTCSRSVSIPGDDTTNEYILDFSSFSQGCDFSAITSAEIEVEMFDNVDVLVELFVTYGPVAITPTSTRTPTPTSSPTPPPVGCVCQCPVFTCEVFRVDDQYYFYTTFFNQFFVPQFFGNGFFSTFFDFFFTPTFFDVWYRID